MEEVKKLSQELGENLKSRISGYHGRKEGTRNRLVKYYCKQHDLHCELVEAASRGHFSVSQPLNEREISVVLALLVSEMPMYQALERVMLFSQEGCLGCFENEFFRELERTSLDLHRCGFIRTARDLNKLGEMTARMHAEYDWAESFKTRIAKDLTKGIRDLPFMKQPGW